MGRKLNGYKLSPHKRRIGDSNSSRPTNLNLGVIVVKSEATKPSDVVGFPKLMTTDSGLVVLFQNSTRGVVVSGGGLIYCIGDWRGDWTACSFTDYNGTVTLTNLRGVIK